MPDVLQTTTWVSNVAFRRTPYSWRLTFFTTCTTMKPLAPRITSCRFLAWPPWQHHIGLTDKQMMRRTCTIDGNWWSTFSIIHNICIRSTSIFHNICILHLFWPYVVVSVIVPTSNRGGATSRECNDNNMKLQPYEKVCVLQHNMMLLYTM